MLESMSDYLSVGVVVFFVLAGLYLIFRSHDKNYQQTMKNLEESYYRYYDNVDDEPDDDSGSALYYEE